MKIFLKPFITLFIVLISISSCQNSTAEDLELFEAQNALQKDEVLSMVASVIVNYPVTAVTNNATNTTLNSNFDMEDYVEVTNKPQLNFPFDITIIGNKMTINNLTELKTVVRRYKGKKRPEFVFPIAVELEDGTTQEIADREALKAYLDTLDEGVKPVFMFPLSVVINNKTVEVLDENELKALMGKPAKGRRPQLIFPLSVILADGSSLIVANDNEFNAYLDTLADGVKPQFDFPISVKKNGETITVDTQEEFDALVKKPKQGKKPVFVFPIAVIIQDGTIQEIADEAALKAYYKSLDKGVRPEYVFPLSIVKNGETITVNSIEALYTLCGK